MLEKESVMLSFCNSICLGLSDVILVLKYSIADCL